ncbi:MAG: hypothetical protein LBT59_24635 [Clostridiales bacterium]|jgi:hypothetical protein|nr:hypothetical protein [Clostridiales bacterium]
MSGPKYSQSKLKLRQQEILRNNLELKIEREKVAQLRTEIEKKMQLISRLVESYRDVDIRNVIARSEKLLSGKQSITLLKNQEDMAEKLISRKPILENTSKELVKENEWLESAVKELSILINKIKQTIEDVLQDYDESVEDIVSDKEKKFKATERQNVDEARERVRKELNDIYLEIIKTVTGLEDSQLTIKSVNDIMHNHDLDEQYKVRVLTNRLKAIKIETLANRRNETLSDLRVECTVLSALIGKEAKTLPNGLDELTGFRDKLKAEAEEKSTCEYVAKTMEEVMKEIGYDLISSEIVSTAEKEVERRLYDFSSESVLNVSTADSGAILFEVLARKKGDAISSSQRANVKQDMERFCPDYALVKSKLEERGVILQEEVLLEPDEKYVRSIEVELGKTASRRAGVKRADRGKYIDG